jgi:hypothetical protein
MTCVIAHSDPRRSAERPPAEAPAAEFRPGRRLAIDPGKSPSSVMASDAYGEKSSYTEAGDHHGK